LEKAVQNIPFLRLAIALILGIVAGQYLQLNVVAGSFLLLFLLSGLLIINLKYRYSSALIFGICFHLFFAVLGIVVYNRYNEKPVFYSEGIFVATILESPVEKPNSYKSTVKINEVISSDSVTKTNEKIIVYFEKSENAIKLKAGDEILFNRSPNPVAPKLNPYDFDYQKYSERRRVYRQVYLATDNWQQNGNSRFSLIFEAEKLRDKLINVYRSQPIDSVEFEILSALTLGYSRELDPETRRVFSSSGAMHVLSVSGLHVAIIFAVINFLFGFMKRNKQGRFIFTASIILVLWFYAFITGLSPSVLRATAMFSVYIIGENMHRKANIYNSLALTAFFILLINPNSLFDIGFQLSYSALFGIVVIEPKLREYVNVKNRVLRYFVSLITISVAAQIATFPLTSFYFSQFPTYFWLTNIFIIPTVAFLTPAGIVLLFVNQIPVVSDIISATLNFTLKYSFKLLYLIDQLPLSVFQVTVNQVQLLLTIGLIVTSFLVLTQFSARNLKSMLFLLFLFSLSVFVHQVTREQATGIIVYNSTDNPIIHLINGKDNYVITEEEVLPAELQYSPFSATQKKLGLKTPLMLLGSDSIRTKDIFLQNRKILFHGRTMYFGKNSDKNTINTKPDFLINPDPLWFSMNHSDSATVIVTNKRYFPKSTESNAQIYCTFNRGAFQKIW
jgi:competence protein ComEC